MSLPQVTVEGRVVAEPELRFSPSGVAVGKFRLVANSKKKDQNGEWVDDKVLWLSVTCFKQLAENVAESVAKGDIVVVTGRLQTDEWETEAGEKRSQIVMVANTVSASLQFRTIKHGSGYKARDESSSAATPDVPALNNTEDPPF